jgi:hypothetical protein
MHQQTNAVRHLCLTSSGKQSIHKEYLGMTMDCSDLQMGCTLNSVIKSMLKQMDTIKKAL